jgi:hypothetical protein
MMDALDSKIEQVERECEELRARLAEKESELQHFREAAGLRPVSAHRAGSMAASGSLRGGRQPGAISKRWQRILKSVDAHYPRGASADDIASFGPGVGLNNLKPKDARLQADKYVRLGYFDAVNGKYKVTPTARDRFGISPAPTTSEDDGISDDEVSSIERMAAE